MSNALQYHLITDCNTQWFQHLITTEGDTIVHAIPFPNELSGPFVSNIYARPLHFTLRQFMGKKNGVTLDLHLHWGGWSLSEKEYGIIEELIALQVHVNKYNKLLGVTK